MTVLRFIGAAYETGDATCWDAAHAHAEATGEPEEAVFLVAAATALVRVIRIDRPDFGFLPLPCRRLSADESALIALLRAAMTETSALRHAARILDTAGGIRLLAAAARRLASLLAASSTGGRAGPQEVALPQPARAAI